jgi:plasmid stabilization system protein ParE
MPRRLSVKLTANFERNLESIEQFLREADLPEAFDTLLDDLLAKVIPNLERFPGLGPALLDQPAGSAESLNTQKALRKKAGDAELRQYILPGYLILYAVSRDAVHLLSIRHHRQLSFDLDALWLAGLKGRNPQGQ